MPAARHPPTSAWPDKAALNVARRPCLAPIGLRLRWCPASLYQGWQRERLPTSRLRSRRAQAGENLISLVACRAAPYFGRQLFHPRSNV